MVAKGSEGESAAAGQRLEAEGWAEAGLSPDMPAAYLYQEGKVLLSTLPPGTLTFKSYWHQPDHMVTRNVKKGQEHKYLAFRSFP